ncbi:MAG: methionine--tRNA ligase [Candidatus Hadarchaeota archaeon]
MAFYVTTPIYYINDIPHIGHAYTTIVADIIARWHRLKGDNVFFLTGLDENSVKTLEAARAQGFYDVQAYADAISEKWLKVWKALNISNDDFVRTTQERHRKNVQRVFDILEERNDIYKGEYEGLYCEGCEAYWAEEELVDGKCPLHQVPPKHLKEENYFFRLSKYRDKILKHIESNPGFIQPEGRKNEVLSFLKSGLKDVSISRAGLKWGIDVPRDPTQKVWVWFDALINYLLPKDHWPADVHFIAKDILRFHCTLWPAMLLAAGYKLPKRIFVHGFLTVDGQKISKSLGNAIDPVRLVNDYSADVLRYYLVREVSLGQDGNFSETKLRDRLNDELADIFGNFVHRVLTFAKTCYGGKIPDGKADEKLESECGEKLEKVEALLENLKVTQALDEIIALAKLGNEYFQSRKPWETIKKEPEKAASCILNCANLANVLCVALAPFIPETSENLAKQLGVKIQSWSQPKCFGINPGHKIGTPAPLFKKVEGKSSSGEDPISMEDFKKVDMRVGQVVSAERVQGSDKLLKLEVKIGEETRTLVAGVADQYSPEDLIGKQIVVVVNLKPAKIRGIRSDGMLLAAVDGDKVSILTLDRPVALGSKVM